MCPGFVVSNNPGMNDEARSGWGNAGDLQVSRMAITSIIRESDLGQLDLCNAAGLS